MLCNAWLSCDLPIPDEHIHGALPGRVVHATVVTVLSGAGARREIVNRRGLVLALDDLRGQARLRGRERPSRKYGYA
jgi:hypothetical protein